MNLQRLILAWVFFSVTLVHAEEPPKYESDIRPIFKAMCFHCHGEEPELAGGLDMRLVRLMKEGGDSGETLTDDDPDESLLWWRIQSDEMPEGPKKLTAGEKDLIRRWIAAGSPTLRDEPDNVEDAKYTFEELNFWSFLPIDNPAVPMVDASIGPIEDAIDAFVAAELLDNELTFSPPAEKATLLRRVTLDLTGLPPSLEELDAFLADESEMAYEKVVDRLLASPSFGIRWGRHWLDVAGYSETDGHLIMDVERQHAWRYRDYVIDSINADKPYDQFMIEQLAGDELALEDLVKRGVGDGRPDPEDARHVEWVTATGLLQMPPDLTARDNTLANRNQVVSDSLRVVAAAALGVTVGCAQCHDHRYDPISAEDYYRFRAVFDPAFPIDEDAWTLPSNRTVDMTPESIRTEREKVEAKAKILEDDLKARRRAVAQTIAERLIGEVAEDVRPQVAAALEKSPDDLSDEELKLLDFYPMVKSVEKVDGSLTLYDREQFEKFYEESLEIEKLRRSAPPARLIMGVCESDQRIPKSNLFFRGDPMQPHGEVAPGEMFVVARSRQVPTIENNDASLSSTGRRLAYARQLFDGTHPLTARVAVNRLWQHHFGRGIVDTPSDFGLNGELPSHPELLDHLATSLMRDGWRMKPLHKRIVLSRTYRQGSQRSSRSMAIDPDNRLLSHASLRRLDAEQIRDSILMVSGLLNEKSGGPSVQVARGDDGKVVIGILKLNDDDAFIGIDDVGDEKFRRSVFLQSQRHATLNMLETWDMPAMAPNCDCRDRSTVAPQSLWFLNDDMILQVTDELAERMFSRAFPDARSRVRDLFRRLYSAEPTSSELDKCLIYLQSQAERFRQDEDEAWQKNLAQWPHAADVRAHATLCQALLSTNRFLYAE